MVLAESGSLQDKISIFLRIAFVVNYLPILSETFILNQIIGLIERGHEVDVYTRKGQGDEGGNLHPDVNKYRLVNRCHYFPPEPVNHNLRIRVGLRLVYEAGFKDPLLWMKSPNVLRHARQAANLNLMWEITRSQCCRTHCERRCVSILRCRR